MLEISVSVNPSLLYDWAGPYCPLQVEMKQKMLGMATVLGAVIFFLSIVSLHLLRPELDPITVGLVGGEIGQFGPLVLFSFVMLAASLSAISLAVPSETHASLIGLSGRVLLNLAGVGLVVAAWVRWAAQPDGIWGASRSGSLILSASAVLLTSGIILLASALDLKIRPDNSLRRFRVLALLATMTLLLYFLTWGRVSGLFERVYLTVIAFWLVVAGLAAMDDWEAAREVPPSKPKRERIV